MYSRVVLPGWVMALTALIGWAAPARASIVSTTDFYVGDISTVTSFGKDQVENANLQVFLESSVTLGSTLNGVYTDNVMNTTINGSNINSNGSIATGTGVDSYIIRFDTDNNGSQATYTGNGQITFDRAILGVIYYRTHLNNSDAVLGAAGVAYSTNAVRDALTGNDDALVISNGGKPSMSRSRSARATGMSSAC